MPFYLHPSGVLTFSDPSTLKPQQGGFREYGMQRSRRATFFDRCSLLWYWYSPLNFFTFTIPGAQVHDDLFYSSAFSKVLENCRTNYKVDSYVWVAEVQKRGAIHFHMVTHRNLDIEWLNDYWINAIGGRSIKNSWKIYRGYYKSAVDVQHVPQEIDCLPAYLSKYLSKGSNRAMRCRSFGSTRDLKVPPICLDKPPDNPYGIQIKTFIQNGVEKEITIRYYHTNRVLQDYFMI